MGGRGLPAGAVDITSFLRISASNESPTRQLRPASVPSTPTTTPHDLLPPRVGPPPVAPTLIPSNRRSMPPHVPDQPVKKQSKWSPEEDAVIIELRGRGMKWEDVSKRLPGRSAISCRLHYQNYLERRSEWDEERKNKLARLYERFKSDMWAKVAEELAVPWRAAEAMHWQLGEADMARRAGVVPFSLTAVNNEAAGNRNLASRSQAPIQPQDNSGHREMRPPSPPTSYGRNQFMPPMTTARPPRRGPINSQPPPPQQTRPMLPPQHLHQAPHSSPHAVVPGTPAPQPQPQPPPPPPPALAAALAHPLGDYRRSPGPGLAPIQPHPPSHNSGPLPSVAQLTTGMSPYGPPSGPPTPTSLPAINASVPRYLTLEQTGTKRRASPDMTRQDGAHRRRLA
ncbi:hypothetical protein V8C37DRAFT_45647 [Trichoderma ceciliae]